MKAITILASALLACSVSGSVSAKPKLPKGIAGLYLAEAQYLNQTQRQLLASTRLQEALDRDIVTQPADRERLKAGTADAQLSWSMHYLPNAIYQKLVDRKAPIKIDDQRWLDLASLQYRRGHWGLTGAVEHSLSRIKKRPRRSIRGERTLLQAQLLFEQQRYTQATRLLSRYRGDFDKQPYADYNHGIALLKMNEGEKGAALLDKVGNLRTSDDTLLALRDLANYTLGNWFLNNDQAGTAIPILKKVRGEGPYSNKALLALGWAYLSSTGKLQRVDQLYSQRCLATALGTAGAMVNTTGKAIERECAPGRTLRIENYGGKVEERLQRAMTAWQVVQERNPLFPGVQETLMALPYALDQMGYAHLAKEQYQKALKALQYEADRINQALDVIHSGQLLAATLPSYQPEIDDSIWSMETLNISNKLDPRLLYQLYAEHDFYEALVNYRQLRRLQTHLDARVQSLKTVDKSQPSSLAKRVRSSLKLQASDAQALNQATGNRDADRLRKQLLSRFNAGSLSTQLSQREDTTSANRSKMSVWMTHQRTSTTSLGDRARTLLPKTETLYKQVGHLAAKHAGYLAMQSKLELTAQLERVNIYMAQARLSLGRLHDRKADQIKESIEPRTPDDIKNFDFNPLLKPKSVE